MGVTPGVPPEGPAPGPPVPGPGTAPPPALPAPIGVVAPPGAVALGSAGGVPVAPSVGTVPAVESMGVVPVASALTIPAGSSSPPHAGASAANPHAASTHFVREVRRSCRLFTCDCLCCDASRSKSARLDVLPFWYAMWATHAATGATRDKNVPRGAAIAPGVPVGPALTACADKLRCSWTLGGLPEVGEGPPGRTTASSRPGVVLGRWPAQGPYRMTILPPFVRQAWR